jgi:hypothetical protein
MCDGVEKPATVPPMDLALRRALVNRKIPDEEARRIHRLILAQKDWDDAHEQVLLERLREIKARAAQFLTAPTPRAATPRANDGCQDLASWGASTAASPATSAVNIEQPRATGRPNPLDHQLADAGRAGGMPESRRKIDLPHDGDVIACLFHRRLLDLATEVSRGWDMPVVRRSQRSARDGPDCRAVQPLIGVIPFVGVIPFKASLRL